MLNPTPPLKSLPFLEDCYAHHYATNTFLFWMSGNASDTLLPWWEMTDGPKTAEQKDERILMILWSAGFSQFWKQPTSRFLIIWNKKSSCYSRKKKKKILPQERPLLLQTKCCFFIFQPKLHWDTEICFCVLALLGSRAIPYSEWGEKGGMPSGGAPSPH